MTTPTLPDNIKSRLSRVHVASRTFKADDGRDVNYNRLVLSGSVNGNEIEVELSIDKKDLTVLSLFDIVDNGDITE